MSKKNSYNKISAEIRATPFPITSGRLLSKCFETNKDEKLYLGKRRKSSTTSNGVNTRNGLKLSFLYLILCAILLFTFLGLYSDNTSILLAKFAFKLGLISSPYVVIIDAGSTGSRILAYKFNKTLLAELSHNKYNGSTAKKLVLAEELFYERKPGLSSFAANPAQGAHTIKLLLDEAKAFIPKEKWTTTPLVLKATAGLRLLPQSQADGILKAVRDLFAKSEFMVDMDAVEIMDGTDEGIFSWFTVNLLLDRLSKKNQAAALDLGGGSTQVTFAPNDLEQVPFFEQYMHEVSTLTRKVNVFTHSYLGLGLMAARHAVFTRSHSADETVLESICVNPIISNRTWTFVNVNYKISGKGSIDANLKSPVVDFEACLDLIKSTILPLVKPKPFTLKQHTVSAFSYYFERAVQSGLIDPFEGGEITVDAFRKKAQDICSTANDDQPFMCFDLTYMSVLLHEGFGLPESKKIKLYTKIDGHHVSWALGYAYSLFTEKYK